jgi:hypothetical protein
MWERGREGERDLLRKVIIVLIEREKVCDVYVCVCVCVCERERKRDIERKKRDREKESFNEIG